MPEPIVNNLIEEAKRVSKNAYAKYSKFNVGCAFTNSNKQIFTGCNVENASFGLTNCAERTAIFKSISEGNKSIDTVVIYTPTQTPTPPCGACRQVIAEFNPNARIISVCDSEELIDTNLSQLLPFSNIPLNEV